MKSPEEVKKTVLEDIRSKGLKNADAAALLGIKAQTFANIMSTKEYFKEPQVRRFVESFGYYEPFLLTGEGDLYAEGEDREMARPSRASAGKNSAKVYEIRDKCFDLMIRTADMQYSKMYIGDTRSIWTALLGLAYSVKSLEIRLRLTDFSHPLISGFFADFYTSSLKIIAEVEAKLNTLERSNTLFPEDA